MRADFSIDEICEPRIDAWMTAYPARTSHAGRLVGDVLNLLRFDLAVSARGWKVQSRIR